ncbi:MAG: diol dehydratase reactivase subunit alpha [Eubacteriales bacterium]
MKLVAGVDIGNATTETAVAWITSDNSIDFVSSGIVGTTGIKGTESNISGIYASIKQALDKAKLTFNDLDLIKINEAAPVIGDVAMDTITETIITESTMIGHNPSSPGGLGTGSGMTINILKVSEVQDEEDYIVVIPGNVDFESAAEIIMAASDRGIRITGAIVQRDDGVLISNRLKRKIPIVDEVLYIEKVPIGMKAAIEVAPIGGVVEQLSNPYGIATMFQLDAEETKFVVPIARAIIGNRSAVVIKTPAGDVQERIIPAGKITFYGEKRTKDVNVDDGSTAVMEVMSGCIPIMDIAGEPGTNAGGMFEKIRQVMSDLTGKHPKDIKIQDLLAVDTYAPQKIIGGLAGEYCMENAVGIAAMVKADKLQMRKIADELQAKVNIRVEVGGVEADMAINGALTTPGTNKPLAIIDMGAGSTDASFIMKSGEIKSIHLAGAGNMVTLLINTELGLDNFDLAEDLKKYPLAKVESMFHIRHEDGSVQFFEKQLDPKIFARVVVVKGEELVFVPGNHTVERIRSVRRTAKEKVFAINALRALKMVCPTQNIRDMEYVVLVGGSALDFEIPQMVTEALSGFGVVAGSGNIRGIEGPRNAVATGLVLKYKEEVK